MNSIFLYGLLAAALRFGNIYKLKQKPRNEISGIKIWRFRLQISQYHFRYHAQTFPVRSWSVRFDRLTERFRVRRYIFPYVSRFHTKKSQMLILCIRNSFWLHSFIDLHFFEKDVAMTSKCRTSNALKIFIVLLKGFEKSIITRALTWNSNN